MELPVTKLKDNAVIPTRAHPGDAGLDLYSTEERPPRARRALERRHRDRGRDPRGARRASSCRAPGLAREHGITLVNGPGLIDAGYRGEVRVLLLNTDPAETVRIEAGARIAQLVVTPVAIAEPVEATALSESARGDGGFGSTGR